MAGNWFTVRPRDPRPVLKTVTSKIQGGAVLMTYKTKPLPLGRLSVTVGPYKKAVGRHKWAVVYGSRVEEHDFAEDAARAFIEYVGRDAAWDAAHGRGRDRNPK